MQELDKKTYLFEAAPVPSAVIQLAVPTILSSLVMVLYNLADTYFVGMLNDPIQNSAVTLAAPDAARLQRRKQPLRRGLFEPYEPLAGRKTTTWCPGAPLSAFTARCFPG